ncbi:MAG: hypothetical protein R3C02_24055 [Planctomycetaceae bacterium]
MPACCCCGRLIDGSGLNDAISACLFDPRYVAARAAGDVGSTAADDCGRAMTI